jgi:hypothetical protein
MGAGRNGTYDYNGMHKWRTDYLRTHQLRRIAERGDGRCFPYTIARALYGNATPANADAIRMRVVEYLRKHRADYEFFLESDATLFDGRPNPSYQGSWDEYLASMEESTTFFDYIVIRVTSIVYDLTILIIGGEPYGNTVVGEGSNKVTILYNGYNHYDSVAPIAASAKRKAAESSGAPAKKVRATCDTASTKRKAAEPSGSPAKKARVTSDIASAKRKAAEPSGAPAKKARVTSDIASAKRKAAEPSEALVAQPTEMQKVLCYHEALDKGRKPYIRARHQRMHGLRLQDVLQGFTYTDAKGQVKSYRRCDFEYDKRCFTFVPQTPGV